MVNVRRFKYLPNVAPFCNILLIMLLSFFAYGTSGHFKLGTVELPKAEHFHPIYGELATVTINREGIVFLKNCSYCCRHTDLSTCLEELIYEYRTPPKILLEVDKEAEFGKIQEVLRAAVNARITVVGLVTHRTAHVGDFLVGSKI
jgi:biopolymer transport protein ExbD